MISKSLILKFFSAANMQRWNDKIRPVELRELDKQAHKMITAFVLGKKAEAEQVPSFSWIEIIQNGLFELLQRIILTDLKPQLFDRIRSESDTYKKLNEWVFARIQTDLQTMHPDFPEKFRDYFFNPKDTINRRILQASHTYATYWEFEILKKADPSGREISDIQGYLGRKLDGFTYIGQERMFPLEPGIEAFINLCGELRFQVRWSHLVMQPRTSVLGHMLMVALLSFLISLEFKACNSRSINNYFTGLFHDLPEVLTRDIIDPVKRSVVGLSTLIKEYESKEMEDKVLRLLPREWQSEMKLYTEMEFEDYIFIQGEKKSVSSEEINDKYNMDKFTPRDGRMIRACDHLAAYFEADLAIKNGLKNPELCKAREYLFEQYKDFHLGGVNFGSLFSSKDMLPEGNMA